MAVALATLPLKSVLAGDGDTLLTTGAGAGTALATGFATGFAATLTGLLTGLATGFATCFTVDLTGAGTFLGTGLATGFVAFLTAAPLTLLFLTALFLTAAVFGAGFLTAGFLTAIFFMTTFFTTAFLTAAFLAGLAFFGCGLATTFLAAGLGLETDFLAATGLATGFFAAVLLTNLLTVFFTGVLALFTVRPFVAAAFGLPALATCVLAGVFPFCALAAVELRVVFAISLHRFWPWRPGVIAHVFYTSKLASGILVPLHAASRSGNVNIPTRLILWLLRLYKRWLSPLLGKRCRFYPSCSDYARIAVTRFGPWRGSLLTSWRLLRCQPLCTGGEDPVPEHFHFPRCRLHGDSNHVN